MHPGRLPPEPAGSTIALDEADPRHRPRSSSRGPRRRRRRFRCRESGHHPSRRGLPRERRHLRQPDDDLARPLPPRRDHPLPRHEQGHEDLRLGRPGRPDPERRSGPARRRRSSSTGGGAAGSSRRRRRAAGSSSSGSSRSIRRAGVLAVVLVLAACGGDEEAADWAQPNGDLASTRASQGSSIDSGNVATLRPAWRYRLPGPVVLLRAARVDAARRRRPRLRADAPQRRRGARPRERRAALAAPLRRPEHGPERDRVRRRPHLRRDRHARVRDLGGDGTRRCGCRRS